MREQLQNYIDGKWVDSLGGTRHEVISPSTEEACTAITLGTKADVDAAVAAAKRAFKTFRKTTRDERIALMERIVVEYKKRTEDLARSMAEEMGAPISFATVAQVGAGIGAFLGTIQALKDFSFTEQHGANTVVYEPIGVVGQFKYCCHSVDSSARPEKHGGHQRDKVLQQPQTVESGATSGRLISASLPEVIHAVVGAMQ